MNATRLLDAAADRTPEWHERRREGVTASEIAVILGLSPNEAEFSLFWRKLGELPPIEDNDAMSLGRHLEAWVADKFEAAHQDEFYVLPGGLYANADRRWQMSTPDRLLYSRHLGVSDQPVSEWEGKTSATNDEWGLTGTDEIPIHYRAQIMWQLDTLGLPVAHLSCLFLHTKQTRHYVIQYNPVEAEILRLAAEDFLDRLNRGMPPPVDGSDSSREALKHLYRALDEDAIAVVPQGIADEYRDACHVLAEAKVRRDAAENQVREVMGTAKTVVDETNRRVCTRSIYTVPAHVREEFTVDKLNPPRRRKKEA